MATPNRLCDLARVPSIALNRNLKLEVALDNKAPDAFRTISEVADELDLPQHVLRFWESRFHDIKPMKRGGGRRYYRPDDIDLLRGIRHLLYGEGYTIRGVQRILREQGTEFVQVVWQEGAPQPPHGASDEEDIGVGDEGMPLPSVLNDAGRTLGGKLASLIGRDFSDRQDDAEQRHEPQMTGAPVPRIDAADRIDHAVHEALPHAEEILSDVPVTAHRPIAVAAAPLSSEALKKLHAALHELGECRKLVDGAAAR
jgi:DNA-binding transcriptional MerR regulator